MANRNDKTENWIDTFAVFTKRQVWVSALTKVLVALSLSGAVAAQEAKVKTVMTQELTGIPGARSTIPQEGTPRQHRGLFAGARSLRSVNW